MGIITKPVMNETDKLIHRLADFSFPHVFNPWNQHDILDAGGGGPYARMDRLRQHFNCTPKYLLIGEAPGYQGCHFSGVPFTNEKLLLEGVVPRIECKDRLTSRKLPWCEPSATIVWGTLHSLRIADCTVMWNAFAWHPHKPGEPMSNRAPTAQELRFGLEILKGVLKLFEPAKLIAVGNKSRETLESLGIWNAKHVRHPSMGGAKQFREGMKKIVYE